MLHDLGEPKFSKRVDDHVDVSFYRTYPDLDDNRTRKACGNQTISLCGYKIDRAGFQLAGSLGDRCRLVANQIEVLLPDPV